jgi:hypothetical protein
MLPVSGERRSLRRTTKDGLVADELVPVRASKRRKKKNSASSAAATKAAKPPALPSKLLAPAEESCSICLEAIGEDSASDRAPKSELQKYSRLSSCASANVDQDLLQEIMASVGVFKHGVLKIFAHNRSNSELIQLLDQMLACGYLIGCTFKEHAQLVVESSSNEVLGRVVANNWNMLLKLIVFLDREDLECGSYHRVHIALPKDLIPARYLRKILHPHHSDSPKNGVHFVRCASQSNCNKKVELVHPGDGVVVVLEVGEGEMWSGRADGKWAARPT